MAQTEHLPIYKAAYDVCLEQVVRKFYGYHKHALSREQRDRIEGYSPGHDLRDGARRVLEFVVGANARRDKTPVLLRLRRDVKAFPNFNSFECAIIWRQ